MEATAARGVGRYRCIINGRLCPPFGACAREPFNATTPSNERPTAGVRKHPGKESECGFVCVHADCLKQGSHASLKVLEFTTLATKSNVASTLLLVWTGHYTHTHTPPTIA